MSTSFNTPRFELPDATEDEQVLGQLEEVFWSSRSRLRREPEFAAELTAAIDLCFGSLVPASRKGDTDGVFASIGAKLAKAPATELDALSTRLLEAAARESRSGSATAAAVSLVAGWLKAAAMEVTAEKSVQMAARQLKSDHELLFQRLLADRKAVA